MSATTYTTTIAPYTSFILEGRNEHHEPATPDVTTDDAYTPDVDVASLTPRERKQARREMVEAPAIRLTSTREYCEFVTDAYHAGAITVDKALMFLRYEYRAVSYPAARAYVQALSASLLRHEAEYTAPTRRQLAGERAAEQIARALRAYDGNPVRLRDEINVILVHAGMAPTKPAPVEAAPEAAPAAAEAVKKTRRTRKAA